VSAVGGPLERRYRWLLYCYPRTHRAEYGEEMLGVLLADTSDDPEDAGDRRARHWPAPGVAADLLVGAGRAGLKAGASPAVRGRWSATAVVPGVALPCTMALASLPAYQAIAYSWGVYLNH
jgi:hypothetical protein